MKLKQLMSVILILCMVATTCVTFALPAVEDEYVSSSISFGYADGDTWTDTSSLEGGKKISAKISVSKTGDKATPIFILLIYKNGKMYDCDVVAQEIGSTPSVLKVSADVPADTEGCQAVAILWNNLEDMDSLCEASLFPKGCTKLRGLYLDGELIDGFDPDVTEYSYVVSEDAEKYPEFSWDVVDSSVKVTYTAPKSYPGTSVVTVEAADSSKTEYRVNYKSSAGEFYSDLKVADSAAGVPVFVSGGLVEGAPAYTDNANYLIKKIYDDRFVGMDVFRTPNAWNSNATYKSSTYNDEWFTFTARRAVKITIFKRTNTGKAKMEENGWTAEETVSPGFLNAPTGNPLVDRPHLCIFTKTFEAGKVNIPNGLTSSSPCIIGVEFAPIGGFPEDEGGNEGGGNEGGEGGEDTPDTPALTKALLSDIKVNGVSLEGFDSRTLEYTYTGEITGVDCPVVTCETAGEATAVVTDPTDLPGYTAITVTEGGVENTYKINYTTDVMFANIADADGNDNLSPDFVSGGLVVGAEAYPDRSYKIAEITDDRFVGMDVFRCPNGWYTDATFKSSTYKNDWFTFEAKRPVKVTMIKRTDTGKADMEANGWTYEVSDNTTIGYINVPTGATGNMTDRPHKHIFTKEFEAGTVNIPNTLTSNSPYIVAVEFAPWGGFAEGEEPEEPDTPVEPDTPEDTDTGLAVMKVKDGRDSIAIIVHDDGVEATTSYLNEALGENELKASVGLITGKIKDERLEYWREIFAEGNLNAESHSSTHTYMGQDNTKAETAIVKGTEMEIPVGKMEAELKGSQQFIRDNFGQPAYVLIRPGVGTITDLEGNTLKSTSDMAMEMMKDTYLAARSSGGKAFTQRGVDTIPPTNYYYMYTVYCDFDDTAEEWMKSIDEAVEKNGIVTYLYHTITEEEESNASNVVETDRFFPMLSEYVKEGKVWNPFYYEAVLYMKECESAQVSMETEGDTVKVTLTDALDNATFNYPLTVRVPVPADWETVSVSQGTRNEVAKTFTIGEENYVYANVVPDGGVATLKASTRETALATLSDLKLNGTSLEGFKSDKFSYVADFSNVGVNCPEITYVANGEATVVVTNPEKLTDKTIVTVTEGNVQNVYTIKYKTTGLISNIEVKEGTSVPVFAVGGLVEDAKAYSDRNYYISEIYDDKFVGMDMFMCPVGWTSNATYKSSTYTDDWFTFETKRDVKITILKRSATGKDAMIANGWKQKSSTNANGFLNAPTTTDQFHKESFTKVFTAGTVSIPNGLTNAPYIVAVEFAPWGGFSEDEEPEEPVEPEVPKATLSEIKVNGVGLEGFDAEIFEYTFEGEITGVDAPEVTYVANGEATAVVTDPTELPGSTVITVTEGGVENTYTINYTTAVMFTDIADADDDDTLSAVYVPGGLVEGGKAYSDKSYKIDNIYDERFVGMDLLSCPNGWNNNSTFTSKTYKDDWLTFNAKRPVRVTLIKRESTGKADMEADGWTYEATDSETGFINIRTGATNNMKDNFHKYLFTKEFEAGTVNIPNALTTYNQHVVAIEFAPWGGFAEDEEPEEPVEPEVIPATLTDIMVDGVSVEGFGSEVFEYTVEVPASQVNMPEVTFTTNGTATAEKEDTFELPGKTVITVSEGEATNIYTINYTLSQAVLATDFTCADADINNASYFESIYVPGGMQVDTPAYTSGSAVKTTYCIKAINDSRLVGADLIRGDMKLYNGDNSDVYEGTAISDFFTFKAARGVEVVILTVYNAGKDNFIDNGYAHTNDTAGFINVYSTRDNLHANSYSKHFDAGDTVEIPNVAEDGNRAVIIALIWDDWADPSAIPEEF